MTEDVMCGPDGGEAVMFREIVRQQHRIAVLEAVLKETGADAGDMANRVATSGGADLRGRRFADVQGGFERIANRAWTALADAGAEEAP